MSLDNRVISSPYSSRDHISCSGTTFQSSVEARDDIDFLSVNVAGRTRSSTGSVTASKSQLNSVEARDNITFNSVVVLDSAKSNTGNVTALESQLNSVEARDKVALTDSFANKVICSVGRIVWQNKKREGEASLISARDSIELMNIISQRVVSSTDKISATNCLLGQVESRDGARLTNCGARSIVVSVGPVNFTNSEKDLKQITESISARDQVTLEGIVVSGHVKSSTEQVKAVNCRLNSVEARDAIHLTDCIADQLASSTSEVIYANGEQLAKESVAKISARDKVRLTGINVRGLVESSTESVRAERCQLADVTARDDIDLLNSSARSCNSSSGRVIITCSEGQQRAVGTVVARDAVTLKNTRITGLVQSKVASVKATDCILDLTEASTEVSMVKSTAKKVVLWVEKNVQGRIVLDRSKIQGDIVIKKKQVSSNFSSLSGRRIIGGIHLSLTTSGLILQISNDIFQITCDDLSDACRRIGAMGYAEHFTGKTLTGTVNGEKYTCVNGVFAPVIPEPVKERDAKAEAETLNITIVGGEVEGNILFEGMAGKVTLESGAVVKGKIEGGVLVKEPKDDPGAGVGGGGGGGGGSGGGGGVPASSAAPSSVPGSSAAVGGK